MRVTDTRGLLRRRGVVVSTLGITQTLAWGSTYYLPAVFADPIAADLHLSREWFFAVFSGSLLVPIPMFAEAVRPIYRYGLASSGARERDCATHTEQADARGGGNRASFGSIPRHRSLRSGL